MAELKSPKSVAKTTKLFPDCLPEVPLLSSDTMRWEKIILEQFFLPPGEMVEFSLEKFLLTINLGQSFQVERILGRKNQMRAMFTGAVGLCPVGTSQIVRWYDDANILVLHLSPSLLFSNALEVLGTERFELMPHLIKQDPLIHQLGLNLLNQLRSEEKGHLLYAESAADFLAVHLLKNYSTCPCAIKQYEGGLSQKQLNQVIVYIQDNLADNISLDEMAKNLDISRYYFCRLFKQSTGLSPYQYVIQQRVEKAKQLLIQRQLSISEIAIACGFSHQSHLNRHFKRLTGVTPKMLQNL